MNIKPRHLVPNAITLMSLSSGVISILFSAQGNLKTAGILIIVSGILDFWDGFSARKLNANTEFGLHLDSLVDMVSLGIAPIILIFQHLRLGGTTTTWSLVAVLMVAVAGASRLARFNLLPQKKGDEDSVGLTITQSGATIAFAVLADIARPGLIFSPVLIIVILAVLAFLMISTISFPNISWLLLTRMRTTLVIAFITSTLIILPIFHALFTVNVGYIGIALGRATYRKVRGRKSSA